MSKIISCFLLFFCNIVYANTQDKFERQAFVMLYYQKFGNQMMSEFGVKCNDIEEVTPFNLTDYKKIDNKKIWKEHWYVKGCNIKDIYEINVIQEKGKKIKYEIKKTKTEYINK